MLFTWRGEKKNGRQDQRIRPDKVIICHFEWGHFLGDSRRERFHLATMSCRYQHMSYDVPLFKVLTCSFCYVYMFKPEATQLRFDFTRAGPVLKAGPEGNFKYSYPPGSVYRADLDNSSMVTQICEPLSENECEKWTTCCQTATKCCLRQQNLPTASQNWSHCPRTWDGFGCFDDTSAGSTAYISCPSYVEHASDQGNCFCFVFFKKFTLTLAIWWIHLFSLEQRLVIQL